MSDYKFDMTLQCEYRPEDKVVIRSYDGCVSEGEFVINVNQSGDSSCVILSRETMAGLVSILRNHLKGEGKDGLRI